MQSPHIDRRVEHVKGKWSVFFARYGEILWCGGLIALILGAVLVCALSL